MKTTSIFSPRRATSRRLPQLNSQRGIALFVALIVMVALSLAGVALVRSIDTTTSITGNIAFRQSALLQANWAVEEAVGHIYAKDSKPSTTDMIVDPTNDLPTQYYVAYFDPTKDSTKAAQPALPAGVPQQLWKKGNLTPAKQDSDTKNDVRYVIQRMCTADAVGFAANQAQCDLMQPKQGLGTTTGDEAINTGKYPLYRVTVRVDGPNNALSFVQAMIRGG
jgi:type IV pilus assembly protein PilX